jgi:small neutral amino acid transporter SnatA (MarC family)
VNSFLNTSLTAGQSRSVRKKAAWQAVLVAFSVIVVFAAFGQQTLHNLGITLPALQCAGGGLIMRVLGENGVLLVTRIAGLLLSAIAVQLIANAVSDFIKAG